MGSTLAVVFIVAGVVVLFMKIRKRRIEEYNKNTRMYYKKQGDDEKIYNEDGGYYMADYMHEDEEYQTQFMNSLKPEGSFMGHDLFSRTKKP